jgi:hypothetical protein
MSTLKQQLITSSGKAVDDIPPNNPACGAYLPESNHTFWLRNAVGLPYFGYGLIGPTEPVTVMLLYERVAHLESLSSVPTVDCVTDEVSGLKVWKAAVSSSAEEKWPELGASVGLCWGLRVHKCSCPGELTSPRCPQWPRMPFLQATWQCAQPFNITFSAVVIHVPSNPAHTGRF